MTTPHETPDSSHEHDLTLAEVATERPDVVLRRFSVDDAETLFKAIDSSRTHLSQFGEPTGSKPAYDSVESTREDIRSPLNPQKLRFGIWDQDRLVGSINLTPGEDTEGAEIGYWLREDATKQGYATVALKAFAQYSFDTLGYSYLQATAHIDNTGSQAVLERTGFTHTHPDATEQILIDFYLKNPRGEQNGEL